MRKRGKKQKKVNKRFHRMEYLKEWGSEMSKNCISGGMEAKEGAI